METKKLEGVMTIAGGHYDENIDINGVITCNGDLSAQSAKLDGVLTVNGNVTVEQKISIGGVVTIKGNIRAKEVYNDSVCTIKGSVEADTIQCQGVLSCKQQLSGDLVEIQGALSAKEVVGEKVVLHCGSKRGGFFKRKDLSHVDLIEATEIEIDGICSQNVNGHTITIGSQCHIDNVDCSGTLSIAPGAEVKTINGKAHTA